MKITYHQHPLDLLFFMVWSLLLIPLAIAKVDVTLRTLLGLPFILFIPGYFLIFALFPGKKTEKGVDLIERIALSFGLSLAVVPLIGFLLNYTPWGITLESILSSVFLFILVTGLIAMYRWYKLLPQERYILYLNLFFPHGETRLDKILTIILILSIIIAFGSLLFVILNPREGEHFTEFYILGPTGKLESYPTTLQQGEQARVILGLVNHEYATLDYTIEVWLLNESSIDENQTIVQNMWFMDKITITLPHTNTTFEDPWMPQWQYNYTFTINNNGTFKLSFLLFKEPTDTYVKGTDYRELAQAKFEAASSSLHLFITIG